MEIVSIELLNQKLKNVPLEIIERVLGYVDALLETSNNQKTYQLNKSQQEILDNQLNIEDAHSVEAATLYHSLKNKYDL